MDDEKLQSLQPGGSGTESKTESDGSTIQSTVAGRPQSEGRGDGAAEDRSCYRLLKTATDAVDRGSIEGGRKRLQPPKKPAWLTIEASPDGGALVTWEKVESAPSYLVEVGNDRGFHAAYFGPRCETTLRAPPGSHVRVRAESAVGHSDWQYKGA